jgi:transcriptional accessory protein Tex/SPT6
VKVTVVAIDLERNRIALTMRTGDASERRGKTERASGPAREKTKPVPPPATVPKPGTIAPNGMRFR